jgi:ATP-dependent helicase/nuclease subunit B
LGKNQSELLNARGKVYLDLAHEIDQSPKSLPAAVQPRPTPPVAARPTGMSFTEIETWIRDPYAIYAKHVLKLFPLPPLVREADPALRGSLYHDIFADFIKVWKGAIPRDQKNNPAFQKMMQIADYRFSQLLLPVEISANWRPRFDLIARAFLNWEANRRGDVFKSLVEVKGELQIENTGFCLRGRADRIDLHHDNTITVIDYKTGNNPSIKQAKIFSPQLSLEGALAIRGGFGPLIGNTLDSHITPQIRDLFYVRLKEGAGFKADDISSGKIKNEKRSAHELAEDAYNKLIDHIRAYQLPEQAYMSRYAPASARDIFGDYDHLARVREWSIGDADVFEEGE